MKLRYFRNGHFQKHTSILSIKLEDTNIPVDDKKNIYIISRNIVFKNKDIQPENIYLSVESTCKTYILYLPELSYSLFT